MADKGSSSRQGPRQQQPPQVSASQPVVNTAQAAAEQPPMDVIGDPHLGLVMLVLLVLGLMNYSMRDPCTC